MSEFSDRQFHVGSLVGLRAFAVDSLGRLSGPSQGGIFTPGLNEASCLVDPYTKAMQAQMVATQNLLRSLELLERRHRGKSKREGVPQRTTPAGEPPKTTKHVVAGLGCQCGFYAYFDGMNDYMRTGRVAAVVEGFGVYTLGTRGFRTSKARVLALVEPPMGSGPENPFTVFAYGGAVAATRQEAMTPLLWSYVRRNYPDTPVYATQEEALAAHPLYEPEVPTPDTDEDFWTRSAS